MDSILNSNHNSCLNELITIYKKCNGQYCGRKIINQTACLYSECGVIHIYNKKVYSQV